MKRVIIESPLRGDYTENIKYAKECMRDSLSRGESPYASHLLLAQEGVLDDRCQHERDLGIEAGFAWSPVADKVAVYTDHGISDGMLLGINRHRLNGTTIVYRTIKTRGLT